MALKFHAIVVAACLTGLSCVAFAADAPSESSAPLPYCKITGTVSTLEKVQKSPWADGAPSPFSTEEIHVAVNVDDCVPHDKEADTGACGGDKGKILTFKLCSPTPVKAT